MEKMISNLLDVAEGMMQTNTKLVQLEKERADLIKQVELLTTQRDQVVAWSHSLQDQKSTAQSKWDKLKNRIPKIGIGTSEHKAALDIVLEIMDQIEEGS